MVMNLSIFNALNSVFCEFLAVKCLYYCLIYIHFKILLLDEFTTKLLASCCKMTDLLAEGITGKCFKYSP